MNQSIEYAFEIFMMSFTYLFRILWEVALTRI